MCSSPGSITPLAPLFLELKYNYPIGSYFLARVKIQLLRVIERHYVEWPSATMLDKLSHIIPPTARYFCKLLVHDIYLQKGIRILHRVRIVTNRSAACFWNFYYDLTLEKIHFRSEKRIVICFLCKSAWLTAVTFLIFTFTANCTVKNTELRSVFFKVQSGPYPTQNRFPLLFLSVNRTVKFFDRFPFSCFWRKEKKWKRFYSSYLSLLKNNGSIKAFFAVLFALFKFCLDRGTVR